MLICFKIEIECFDKTVNTKLILFNKCPEFFGYKTENNSDKIIPDTCM